jgi:hypothetical protein
MLANKDAAPSGILIRPVATPAPIEAIKLVGFSSSA